jgi:hypothetical protein
MSNSAEFNGWCIITGEDFRQKFFVKDPTLPKINNPNYDPAQKEDSENQSKIYQPKDLTGFSAKMDIRQGPSRSSPLLISLETGLGITIGSPNEADGSIELFIDNSVTNAEPFLSFADNEAYYDIFITPPVGDNTRLFVGSIKVEGSVTDV